MAGIGEANTPAEWTNCGGIYRPEPVPLMMRDEPEIVSAGVAFERGNDVAHAESVRHREDGAGGAESWGCREGLQPDFVKLALPLGSNTAGEVLVGLSAKKSLVERAIKETPME